MKKKNINLRSPAEKGQIMDLFFMLKKIMDLVIAISS